MITPQLDKTIEEIVSGFEKISEERKAKLNALTNFIQKRINEDQINLTFICIHNSRRSHLSQFWSQTAAHYYGLHHVHCYSGGTEVTAMYPTVAVALRSLGVEIKELSTDINKVYSLGYAENEHPVIAFSKMYDDSFNPDNGFGAIMVCSSADSNCPYISTAAERILVPFEDPKEFDGSEQETEGYISRAKEIATELFYAFSQVKH